MSNSIIPLKRASLSGPNWQGMLLILLLGFMPQLATADATTDRLLALTNQARSQSGKAALCRNALLEQAATRYCQQMVSTGNFNHIGTDGKDPGDRIRDVGYNWITYGENIAWGYPTPDDVHAGWMGSTGHRANILNGAFKEVGFARCGSQYSYYWVTNFATSASGTNCSNTTATTGSTGTTGTTTNTSTMTAAQKAGLAMYNSCQKYVIDWHYDAAKNKYFLWYNNSCFRYDPVTTYMHRMVLNSTTKVWGFTQRIYY